jgi:release factor glutamine methyltransferase
MQRLSPVAETAWTILKLIHWAADYLKDRGIDSPRTTAEILLAHALGTERIRLYMDHDKPLGKPELAAFKALLKRRLRREPVAYIIGRKGFWSLELAVNADVLIPRPETESLVEAALSVLAKAGPAGGGLRVLDLGTGSGAIILAIASQAGRHRYLATDVCPRAIAVAQANAREAGLAEAIGFVVSDWFAAFRPSAPVFDLIVSNPPYVPRPALAGLQPEVARFEPRLALDGDSDGLESYRRIIAGAVGHLKPAGLLLLEIGCDQKAAVREIAERVGGYGEFACAPDLAGRDRVVTLQKRIAIP